jgi:hypothetical protein
MKVRNAAIAMSALAAAAVLAGCTDDTQGDSKTLSYTEPPESEQQAAPIGQPPGRQGPEPGSGFAFGTPLQDSSGKAVGELNATCIITQGQGKSEKAQCNGTANLPDGQLVLDVGGSLPRNITGAVVGGTGDYTGATGTFESKDQGKGSKDTFNITLP